MSATPIRMRTPRADQALGHGMLLTRACTFAGRRHLHRNCSRDHRRAMVSRVHRALRARDAARLAAGTFVVRIHASSGLDFGRAHRIRTHVPGVLGRARGRNSVAGDFHPGVGLRDGAHLGTGADAAALRRVTALGQSGRARADSSSRPRSCSLCVSVQESRGERRTGESILSRLFHGRFHLAYGVDGRVDEIRDASGESVSRRSDDPVLLDIFPRSGRHRSGRAGRPA